MSHHVGQANTVRIQKIIVYQSFYSLSHNTVFGVCILIGMKMFVYFKDGPVVIIVVDLERCSWASQTIGNLCFRKAHSSLYMAVVICGKSGEEKGV